MKTDCHFQTPLEDVIPWGAPAVRSLKNDGGKERISGGFRCAGLQENRGKEHTSGELPLLGAWKMTEGGGLLLGSS